jgi:methylthioribulose-1-phosphate dehydratase
MNDSAQRISLSQFDDATRILEAAGQLAETGRDLYRRGWVLGTSGNFSAVIVESPLRILITSSGMDKGRLTENNFVLIDEKCEIMAGAGKPSDEAKLHITIAQRRGAKSVLHTHSVWGTILSDAFATEGGVRISGWEMLKGLAGVRTHEHAEWLPIIENSQDMTELARNLGEVLFDHPAAHGFLLRGHGMYTWGMTLGEARRHVEIIEFLLEVTGRIHYDARKR